MKKMTEQEALAKLMTICSQAEHCSGEMVEKMRKWELEETAQARIMEQLVKGKFVDDERFTRAFAKDKLRYNKWGRRKIEQALWLKHIPNDISQRVLDELGIGGGNSRSDDDSEYVQILRELLRNKARSVKAKNTYERNGKLIKFALGRGFSMDVIMKVIEKSDEYDFAEDED